MDQFVFLHASSNKTHNVEDGKGLSVLLVISVIKYQLNELDF